VSDQNGGPHGPPTQTERLAELRAYRVLDTDPEPAFDGLVRLAAVIAEVPTALVGLIDEDRQWFKAKLGMAVDIVENGSSALDAVRRIRYDVILMDMHMPVMDGLEATRRIRAELPAESQPRIIALTASVTAQDRTACAEAGMDGYLAKPVRAVELSAALDIP
jgi:CheY-like chemotaxis protein